MSVNVFIDNQYLSASDSDFRNRTDRIQEGRYVFLIPTTASMSTSGVGRRRTHTGVILEHRRAEEIYKDLALQAIDPGLLSQESEDTATSHSP